VCIIKALKSLMDSELVEICKTEASFSLQFGWE